jgi:predicted RNase H-like HicB family nuclease
MKTATAVVERCSETGLFVGYVPGFPGACTQAETLDELHASLREVIEMLLEDGEPRLEMRSAEWNRRRASPAGYDMIATCLPTPNRLAHSGSGAYRAGTMCNRRQ